MALMSNDEANVRLQYEGARYQRDRSTATMQVFYAARTGRWYAKRGARNGQVNLTAHAECPCGLDLDK